MRGLPAGGPPMPRSWRCSSASVRTSWSVLTGVTSLQADHQSSKSIYDTPLVFEGRTLDPLRHILASASRAFLALLRGQIEGRIEPDCQGSVLPGGVRNNPLQKVARMVKDLRASRKGEFTRRSASHGS